MLLRHMTAQDLDALFASGIGAMTPVYNGMADFAKALRDSVTDDVETDKYFTSAYTGGQ